MKASGENNVFYTLPDKILDITSRESSSMSNDREATKVNSLKHPNSIHIHVNLIKKKRKKPKNVYVPYYVMPNQSSESRGYQTRRFNNKPHTTYPPLPPCACATTLKRSEKRIPQGLKLAFSSDYATSATRTTTSSSTTSFCDTCCSPSISRQGKYSSKPHEKGHKVPAGQARYRRAPQQQNYIPYRSHKSGHTTQDTQSYSSPGVFASPEYLYPNYYRHSVPAISPMPVMSAQGNQMEGKYKYASNDVRPQKQDMITSTDGSRRQSEGSSVQSDEVHQPTEASRSETSQPQKTFAVPGSTRRISTNLRVPKETKPGRSALRPSNATSAAQLKYSNKIPEKDYTVDVASPSIEYKKKKDLLYSQAGVSRTHSQRTSSTQVPEAKQALIYQHSPEEDIKGQLKATLPNNFYHSHVTLSPYAYTDTGLPCYSFTQVVPQRYLGPPIPMSMPSPEESTRQYEPHMKQLLQPQNFQETGNKIQMSSSPGVRRMYDHRKIDSTSKHRSHSHSTKQSRQHRSKELSPEELYKRHFLEHATFD